MASSPEAIKKSIRIYFLIFGILCVFTVLTVAVATIPALDVGGHGFDIYDMWLGLAIATVKASLVGAIFMHLNSEKRLIYLFFGIAIVFAVALFALVGLAFIDPIFYENFF